MYQTDGEFEKLVESGLSTFETWRLVAEIYFSTSFGLAQCVQKTYEVDSETAIVLQDVF